MEVTTEIENGMLRNKIEELKKEIEKLKINNNSLVMDIARYKGRLEQAEDNLNMILEKLID